MTSDNATPDQIPGAAHPRETAILFGQDTAEQAFLSAYNSDRLHHGWLLTGPRGIGKATLAWRIARFLLATPPAAGAGLFEPPPAPATLDIDPGHPVARRIAAGSDPGLAHVTRTTNEKNGALRDVIVVDDIRKLNRFFGLTSTEGGRRVVIVDCADEMNVNAANALLKMLEEPPAQATLLLVSHQPSRLLPTIRSRCRTLPLAPLDSDAMALALRQCGADLPGDTGHLTALAAGSVGAAIRLINLGGLEIYAELVALMNTLPRLDRPRALALAEAAARRGAAERLDLLLTLIDIALARLARTGATGRPPLPEAAPGESGTLLRLASDPGRGLAWADTAAAITARARHGQAVNLDPATLVLDTVHRMQQTAAG